MAIGVPGGVPGDAQRAWRAPSIENPASGAPAGAVARLHWIDWLRVAAIAGVFVYHTLRPFDSTGWHVKNAETNDLIGASQILFSTFGLAVLFLLAGAGSHFALRRRNWQTYLRERVARLMVPFVVGTLLLSPIQGLIEEIHKGPAAGWRPDIVGWWAGMIEWVVGRGVSPSVFGIGYHLWFLGFLFSFAVVGLPIFAALDGRRGRRAIALLAGRVAALPGSMILFALPVAALLIGFAPFGAGDQDWSSFGWYLGYFVLGYILVADERFLAAARRDLRVAIGVAVAGTAGLVALDLGEWMANSASRGFDLRSLAIVVVFIAEGWASSLVVLNIGLRVARLQRPVGPHLGELVLPVYVVHQPVILAVALFVVQWPMGILPKWIALFGISGVVTLALVELGLRAPVTRIFLGARIRPAAQLAGGPGRAGGREPLAGRPSTGAQHARPR